MRDHGDASLDEGETRERVRRNCICHGRFSYPQVAAKRGVGVDCQRPSGLCESDYTVSGNRAEGLSSGLATGSTPMGRISQRARRPWQLLRPGARLVV